MHCLWSLPLIVRPASRLILVGPFLTLLDAISLLDGDSGNGTVDIHFENPGRAFNGNRS